MTTGSFTIGNTSPGTPLYAQRQWSGADTAKPFPKVKPWNPYNVSSFRMDKELCLVGTSWYGGPWSWSESYQYDSSMGYPWQNSFTANDQIDLLSKLADRIRGHSFNAAIAAAEVHQSLDTITDGAKRVFGMLYYAKRGNYAAALRQLGAGRVRKLKTTDVSDFVLSLRYGWQPILNDVYEAAKFLETAFSGPRALRYKVSKRVPWRANTSTSPSVYTVESTGYFVRTIHAWLSEPPSTVRSLGLTNPASVLWEKLPWSFVGDWFIPIGNYLDVLGFIPGLSASYATVDFARASGKLLDGTRKTNTSNYQYIGGNVKYSMYRVERTGKSSSITLPRPEFKSLDQAFSLTHIQNAAALIWSQNRRLDGLRNTNYTE